MTKYTFDPVASAINNSKYIINNTKNCIYNYSFIGYSNHCVLKTVFCKLKILKPFHTKKWVQNKSSCLHLKNTAIVKLKYYLSTCIKYNNFSTFNNALSLPGRPRPTGP